MGRARNILVVDDDADFRAALREVLENEGCTVYEAADGRVALSVLRVVVPDLICLDLTMPVMNGWAFHAELQKDPVLSLIPIALLSGADDMPFSPSMHVLHKPVDLPNLLGLLHAIEEPERPSASIRLQQR